MKHLVICMLAVALLSCGKPHDEISGEYYDYTITMQPERPYMLSYTDKMMMKAMMATKVVGGGTEVKMTYDDMAKNIEAIDNLTRGIGKIVYLVGWQYDGHDSKYPALAGFNEALKSPADSNARQSYLRLVEFGKKHNTIVSAHINLNDAYENSPLWNYYVENDLLTRNADGSLRKMHQWGGEQSYNICFTNEWKKGITKKRIDDVIDLLQLDSAKTVHIDVFLPFDSPYHNLTKDDESVTMRKILRYWRDKGVDVTTESWYMTQRTDQFIGLQPAVWWIDMPVKEQLHIPASLGCGGQNLPGWGIDGYNVNDEEIALSKFLFGDNMHGEELLTADTDFEAFKKEFCISTLVWTWLNKHKIVNYDDSTFVMTYSDGITVDGQNRTISDNGHIVRNGNDIFIPAEWIRDHNEIIAFSEQGYRDRVWRLPASWNDVDSVKIYNVGIDGLTALGEVAVVDGNITLSLDENQMISISATHID